MLGRLISGKSLLALFHKQPPVMAAMYQCTLEACSLPGTVAVLAQALSDALLIVTVLLKIF